MHNRSELREIASIYKAKIIDLSPDSMVFELIGKPDKIDAFLKMFTDYKILEQCRTGVTALERGGMHQHMQKPPQEVREAQLPLPGNPLPGEKVRTNPLRHGCAVPPLPKGEVLCIIKREGMIKAPLGGAGIEQSEMTERVKKLRFSAPQ